MIISIPSFFGSDYTSACETGVPPNQQLNNMVVYADDLVGWKGWCPIQVERIVSMCEYSAAMPQTVKLFLVARYPNTIDCEHVGEWLHGVPCM